MHKEMKCEECPEIFTDFGKFRRHCAKVHKGKKYTTCPVCKKEIREMWIQRHQKKCEGMFFFYLMKIWDGMHNARVHHRG